MNDQSPSPTEHDMVLTMPSRNHTPTGITRIRKTQTCVAVIAWPTLQRSGLGSKGDGRMQRTGARGGVTENMNGNS